MNLPYYHLQLAQQLINNNTHLNIYVDSFSIIQMMLGLKQLSSKGNIVLNPKVSRHFKKSYTLVHTLFFNEQFEKVGLLIPHQNEFLLKLEALESQLETHLESSNEDYKYFFEEEIKLSQIKQLDPANQEDIENYARELQSEIEDIYKANYLMNPVDWRFRLEHIQKNVLKLEEYKINYTQASRDSLFKEFLAAFKKLRSGPLKSDLNDAFALYSIMEMLKQHKLEEIDAIPIFFDTQGTFQQVIKETETEELFQAKVGNTSFSVVQSSNFFLARAALLKEEINVEVTFSEEDYGFYQKIKNTENKKLIHHKFDKVKETEEQFLESSFLYSFWTDEEKVLYIQDLIQYSKFPKEAVTEIIINNIKKYQERLNAKLKKFTYYIKIYAAIERSLKKLEDNVGDNLKRYKELGEIDIPAVFSLKRFALPKEHLQKVQNSAQRLLIGDDEDCHLEYANVIEYLLDGILEDKQEDLLIGITLLWILDSYDLIVEILDGLPDYKMYSLGAIHMAALVKKADDESITLKDLTNRIEVIIQRGRDHHDEEGKHKHPFDPNKHYRPAIAVSTAYFQLWRKKKNPNFFNTLREPIPLDEKDNLDKYLIDAVKYAKKAIEKLEENNSYAEHPLKHSYYCYVLNIYIYYTTMGLPDKDFLELGDKVGILANVEGDHPRFWMYIYDDTLALFNLRKTQITNKEGKDIKAVKRFHQLAKKHNIQALKYVLSSEEKRNYENLKSKIENLFIYNIDYKVKE